MLLNGFQQLAPIMIGAYIDQFRNRLALNSRCRELRDKDRTAGVATLELP
jgi:hypothetical protein